MKKNSSKRAAGKFLGMGIACGLVATATLGLGGISPAFADTNGTPDIIVQDHVVAPPEVSKVSYPAQKKVQVTLSKHSGATKYQIRYSASSDMRGATTVTVPVKTCQKTFSVKFNDKTYYVSARVQEKVDGKVKWSEWGDSRIVVSVTPPKFTHLYSPSTKKVSVSLNTSPNAWTYQVRYSASPDMKAAKVVKLGKVPAEKMFKVGKSKKAYYVQTRCAKTGPGFDAGLTWSPWSKAKKVVSR